jgi:hypothetical protein
VHPEGGKRNTRRRVAPLEHVVHPEGHAKETNEASGTLGARGAS